MDKVELRWRNRYLRLLLVIGALLIFIGIILMTRMLLIKDSQSHIKVYLSDGVTRIVEFDSLSLVPGDSCLYYVKLKSTHSRSYKLKIHFSETEENTLKNFARVKILSGDKVVCDELLATAFAQGGWVLPVDFKTKENTELTVIYYLPIDVGNEAKNAEATFELLLQVGDE